MTAALLAASGELGLEAFLPPPDRVFHPSSSSSSSDESDPVPHLPLTPTWTEAQFALSDVLPPSPSSSSSSSSPWRTPRGITLRTWTLHLLARYRFAIGETPSHFAMLSGPSTFSGMVVHLRKHADVALLCVNDDVAIEDERVGRMFREWAGERWGDKAGWER